MTNMRKFHEAVDLGDLDIVQTIVADDPQVIHTFTAEPREWGEEQWLPIHRAAWQGHSDIVQYLLEHGARPDARTRFRTPSHARCTAMHFAAAGGHVDILEALVFAGADVNVLDTANTSPISWAARYGRAQAAAYLAQHHALLEIRDTNDRTPLHLAILGDRAAAADGDPNATVAALLHAMANANAHCNNDLANFTPLHRCVNIGADRIASAKALCEAGADPLQRDPKHEKSAYDLAKERAAIDPAMQPFVQLFEHEMPS